MNGFSSRRDVIAQLLDEHAREGGDVGDLLAAACRAAAVRLDGSTPPGYDIPRAGDEALVAGRPGSWEADHVLGLAGGWKYDRRDI